MGMGAIFDDEQAVFAGDGQERIHIGEAHGQVNRHEGASAGGDGCADSFGRQAVGVRVHVGKYGHAAGLEDGHGGAVPGIRGHDDFVAEFEVEGLEGHGEGDGAIGQAQAVLDAVQFAKSGGELFGVGTGHRETAPVAAFDDFDDALEVGASVLRPG